MINLKLNGAGPEFHTARGVLGSHPFGWILNISDVTEVITDIYSKGWGHVNNKCELDILLTWMKTCPSWPVLSQHLQITHGTER